VGNVLCCVSQYYFRGTPSWTWYYPYHYAPLLTDLRGLAMLMTASAPSLGLPEWFSCVALLLPVYLCMPATVRPPSVLVCSGCWVLTCRPSLLCRALGVVAGHGLYLCVCGCVCVCAWM
jgi:hypothetical protein